MYGLMNKNLQKSPQLGWPCVDKLHSLGHFSDFKMMRMML